MFYTIGSSTIWISEFGSNCGLPVPIVIKLFTYVIYEFSCKRVFDRLDWNSLPGTNTQAYYENLLTKANFLEAWALGPILLNFLRP
jgi:hypothetical protein